MFDVYDICDTCDVTIIFIIVIMSEKRPSARKTNKRKRRSAWPPSKDDTHKDCRWPRCEFPESRVGTRPYREFTKGGLVKGGLARIR